MYLKGKDSSKILRIFTMNATSAILGIQKIQRAFSILTALQMTSFLWPQQSHVHDGSCFDFIVCGAGSAGSVIANRLTEIEDATVLLIEAGGDPPVESVIPGLLLYLKNTSVDWNYKTEDDGYSQQFHKNHGAELTRGKMLGGSSSINFLLYTRGNPHDLNGWANITGDESWKWENILPYFKKSERLVDPVLLEYDGGKFHGTDGYLGTTRNYNEEVLKYFEAFKEAGQEIVMDINGNTSLGYTEGMLTIADHLRQSTAQSFLHPIRNRPNLFVLKNTLASKILFDDDKNAIGVEVILSNNKTASFKAKKEVVISAGSINTPQLLMLSGVGPQDHLLSHNITVICDLPVGQSLQDHVLINLVLTMGPSFPSKPVDPTNIPFPLITGYARINKSQEYPDYQTLSFVMNEPTGALQFCAFFYSFIDELCNSLYEGSINKSVFYSSVALLQPESRGKILLQSTDPKQQPLIYTGYYSKAKDLENHATYLQDFLRVQETKFFKSVHSELIVPEICGCGKMNATLKYWKCVALCLMSPGYHYAASCPMGVVVDSRLNVLGVQKLRIVDASVMPTITRANTNAATIMIAERAADFIKKDHYCKVKTT